MCLAAIAIHASARWPLVIASNRDEFFDRPTLALARWQTRTGQTIISGRDARAGGTWLGITPSGRVALLTNVREPQSPVAPQSRGQLVMRWLASSMGSDGDADRLMAQTDASAYGGFNLVLGDMQTNSWTWFSNRPGSGLRSQALQSGVYGLSNAALDSPWPKTLALKAAMQHALATESDAPLWQALADRKRANLPDLPATGLPVELESALSSAFVDSPERGYGTRCSTVLLARWLDDASALHVSMTEKTHHPSGGAHQTHQAFEWQKPPAAA